MTKPLQRILITGGTGFIGRPLCQRLSEEGYILYILTRKRNLIDKESPQTKFYLNNLSEIDDVDIDIVINLAGETIAQRWSENAKRRIHDSRIITTRTLVNFMRSRKKKPTLFLSGSAVGYYGIHAETELSEESPSSSNQSEFSSSLCRDWEDEASKAVDLGIRTVFLRMGPVLAKDGGMIAKLFPSFYLGLGSQIGTGQQWLSWIDRDDLINLILFIIQDQKIEGPVNATAPNPVTNKDFSIALAKALHRPCFLTVPEFVFKMIFGQMAKELMINGQKVLPEKALRHGFDFSCSRIEQSFAKL